MTSFLDWENRLRVRLTVDLTRYHPSLVAGAEGVVTSFFGSASDRFWKVAFPNAGVLDILPGSLEILDKEFIEWCEEDERKRYDGMVREAKEGVWHLGPRGGFRGFCINGNGVARNHEEAERIAEMLKKRGIPVRKEVME